MVQDIVINFKVIKNLYKVLNVPIPLSSNKIFIVKVKLAPLIIRKDRQVCHIKVMSQKVVINKIQKSIKKQGFGS